MSSSRHDEERIDDRVLVAELLEHARVGRELPLRRLLPGLQAELAVEHLAQLRRRVQVELPSGLLVDLGLARRHPVADPLAHLVEVGDVEPDAARLHPREHRRQRQLDVVQQRSQALLVDLLLHHRHEQADGRGLGGGATPRVLVEQLPAVALVDPGEQVGAEVPLADGARGRSRSCPGRAGTPPISVSKVTPASSPPAAVTARSSAFASWVRFDTAASAIGRRERAEVGEVGVGGLRAAGGDGGAADDARRPIRSDHGRGAACAAPCPTWPTETCRRSSSATSATGFMLPGRLVQPIEQRPELQRGEQAAHLLRVDTRPSRSRRGSRRGRRR